MAAETAPPHSKRKHNPLRDTLRGAGRWLGSRLYSAPYWFFLFVLFFIFVAYNIQNTPAYRSAWLYVRGDFFAWMIDTVTCNLGTYCPPDYSPRPPALDGIAMTLTLAVLAYTLALLLALPIGIIRANPPRAPVNRVSPWQRIRSLLYVALYNLLTFYVEFMRGIPSIVFVLLAAFVLLPTVRNSLNDGIIASLGLPEIMIRSIDPLTGILALAMIYSAFMSETIRAGVQSISKGQSEAARSLGMNYFQTMRLVVVPQAIRAVLPPLGNDFIAMIKDTALLTILGTNEITQLARKWVGTTFHYPETFSVLAVTYLSMTLTGSLIVRWIERRLRRHER